MQRVNLTKYGFVRDQSQDFSDDGTRFTCYTVKGADRIRVSKATYNGTIFLAARLYGNLRFEEYKNLPHFKDLETYNGYPLSVLTENDLQNFYNNCVLYQREFEEAESKIVYPSEDELKERLLTIKELRTKEYQDLINLIKDNTESILFADKWDLSDIVNYTKTVKSKSELDVNKRLNTIKGTIDSRWLIDDKTELEPSWYYTQVVKKVKEVKNKCLQMN